MTRVLAFMLLVVGPLEVAIAQPVLPDGAPVSHTKRIWQDAVPQTEPAPTRGNRSPYRVKGQTYTVLPTADDYVEEGIASWYGMKFHGRQTANGDIYDVFAATAAHRSLPIPSYVRVTNLRNQRTVVLRVNDRGPFHDSRLIDLSYGAALALGFAESGTAPVRVEVVTPPAHESRAADRLLSDTDTYSWARSNRCRLPSESHRKAAIAKGGNIPWRLPRLMSGGSAFIVYG